MNESIIPGQKEYNLKFLDKHYKFSNKIFYWYEINQDHFHIDYKNQIDISIFNYLGVADFETKKLSQNLFDKILNIFGTSSNDSDFCFCVYTDVGLVCYFNNNLPKLKNKKRKKLIRLFNKLNIKFVCINIDYNKI